MELRPGLKVTRFAKTKAADLMLFPVSNDWCVGLRCVENQDDDECLAILGPKFGESSGPYLLEPGSATVVLFGTDYVIRASTDPNAWSEMEPPRDIPSIAIADEKVFFRVNSSQRPAGWSPRLVEATTGKLLHQTPSIVAYCSRWKLVSMSTVQDEQTILEFM